MNSLIRGTLVRRANEFSASNHPLAVTIPHGASGTLAPRAAPRSQRGRQLFCLSLSSPDRSTLFAIWPTAFCWIFAPSIDWRGFSGPRPSAVSCNASDRRCLGVHGRQWLHEDSAGNNWKQGLSQEFGNGMVNSSIPPVTRGTDLAGLGGGELRVGSCLRGYPPFAAPGQNSSLRSSRLICPPLFHFPQSFGHRLSGVLCDVCFSSALA